jgi:hypothetical protein
MICYHGFVQLGWISSILLLGRHLNLSFIVTCFIRFAIFIICELREEIFENEIIFDDLFVVRRKRLRLFEL